MQTQTITYTGGWFQQTSLDLDAVFNYFKFKDVEPNTGVNTSKLRKLYSFFDLERVRLVKDIIDYVECITTDQITFRYFEDGLYTIQKAGDDYQGVLDNITSFEKDIFVPTISELFARGAPLKKIRTTSNLFEKYIVVFPPGPCADIYEEIISEVENNNLEVVRTKFIFFVHPKKNIDTNRLIEMQLFFSEISTHLKEYLKLHRDIWEKITNLHNHEGLTAPDARKIKKELLTYKSTIKLNQARLTQMRPFLDLRRKYAEDQEVREDLQELFSIKIESLKNSLHYIQQMWVMTNDYLDNAMEATEIIIDSSNQTVLNTVRIVTSLFGVNLIFRLAGEVFIPTVQIPGLIYVIVLILFVVVLEILVRKFINRKVYNFKIKDQNIFDKSQQP